MAIERFTLDEFKKALPEYFEYEGVLKGEHCFACHLPLLKVMIRSSIYRGDSLSGDTGENSIRTMLTTYEGAFASPQIMTYRTVNWRDNLMSAIEEVFGMYIQLDKCPVCGVVPGINQAHKGANAGRWFAACRNQSHKFFRWIDRTKRATFDEIMELQSEEEERKTDVIVSVAPVQVGKLDLSRLNPQQLAVVNHQMKTSLVVDSAAGSGKTTLMTYMVADMIYRGVDPGRMLIVTFSVKAAAEMRRRIAKLVWPEISERELSYLENPYKEQEDTIDGEPLNHEWLMADPIRKMIAEWVCTIHAMSFRILKATGMKLKVIDNRQKWELDQLLRDMLDEFKWKVSLKNVKAYLNYAVESLYDDNQIESLFSQLLEGYADIDENAPQYLAAMYVKYQQFMNRRKIVDFAMMQAMVLKRARNDPGFRAVIGRMFDFVIIDEGQDTDDMQFEIIEYLHSKTAMIGDPWQSLYRFRGAIPEIMEEQFLKVFPGQRFELGINYRSTKTIVDASTKLILNNYIGRDVPVKSVAPRPGATEGNQMTFTMTKKFVEMADEVIGKVKSLGKPGDWYVLSRTRAECAALHLAFVSANVPAINLSGGNLMFAPHIRKVMAYAKLASNYEDARNDLDTIIEVANVASSQFMSPVNRKNHEDDCDQKERSWTTCACPVITREGKDHICTRYYGEKSVRTAGSWNGILRQRYEKNNGGYLTVAAKGATDLVDFVDYLESKVDSAYDCVSTIITESVRPWLAHTEGIDEQDMIEGKGEDFDVILNLITPEMKTVDMIKKMEELSAKMENSEDGTVHIGTGHAVKGLQRPYVAANITRMPIIPPARKEGELPVGIPNSIEDERNILYVMITRAELESHIFQSAEWNGMEVPLSRFVNELEFDLDNVESE